MSRPGLAALAACVVLGCVPSQAAEPTATDDGDVAPPPRGPATLALAGDAMLGRGISRLFSNDPNYAAWRGTAEALGEVDVLAFNLETAITDAEAQWEGKNFHFKLAPAAADDALTAVLRDNGAAAAFASTANNHTLDFLVEGLLDTIEHLDGFGMAYAGSGVDLEDARAPAIVTTAQGVRIGFLAASTVCSCGDVSNWGATETVPGAWMIASSDEAAWDDATQRVRQLSAQVDYVVFSLHWGVNYVESWPVPWMVQRAQQLVDAGVDVIYGHSAHHVLPVERLGDAVVLYGTGDFIDDYSGVEGFRNDLSYVARVTLQPQGQPEITLVPLRLEHGDEHFAAALPASDPDFDAVMTAAGLP